jgi:hypothetical protein
MVKAQISDPNIVHTIEQNRCSFDTSPAALVELKHQGVSEPQMKILASSAAIRREISKLMTPGTNRRVAITAFVGDGARAFIRSPKAVEITCWPKAGGTNPLELRRLQRAGAHIRFVDRLHMKVYWAARRGVIITSANLSTNALGAGDLKEFGVLLPPDSFPIDSLMTSLKSRPFNKKDMERLEREHRKLKARQRQYGKVERVSYQEWFELPARPEWKLGWWDTPGAPARQAKEIARADFNERSPHNFIVCRKHDYQETDWVLSFRLSEKRASSPRWVYVDFTVKISRNEGVYSNEYPCQAVQVLTPRHYPQPPFAITKNFRAALREATITFGIKRLQQLQSTRAPKDFLALIRKKIK